MRVVLIALHYAEYSIQLAKSLALNNEVLLLLRSENRLSELGDIDAHELPTSLTIREIPFYPLKDPRTFLNWRRIVRLVNNFQPEILHMQEIAMTDMGLASMSLHKIPCVLTIHDHVSHSGCDSKTKWRKKLWKGYLRQHCCAAIVHGEKIRKETEETFPYLAGRVFSVPHGPLGLDITQQDDIEWVDGQLLFFGRVEEYKGLIFLIDAVKKIKAAGIKVNVIVAGRGSDLEKNREKIEDDVFWEIREGYASAEEVKKLMLSSNIIVMPYTDATQSGVAAMAINYGRPIIATNVGSIPEIVIDGYNGILVPPKDSGALANAILSIVEDKKRGFEMASNARSLSVSKFSWTEIANKTLNIYEKVLKKSC